MEGAAVLGDGLAVNLANEVKVEEDEEDFQSCCEDEDELKEMVKSAKGGSKDSIDEFSVDMFFKGVSVAEPNDSASGLSGIGVVMERATNSRLIQVQKKLDFYVDQSVADYLALMDGLIEAVGKKFTRVFAFTDSKILCDQIMHEERLENLLLEALRQRILDHANGLESFVLKLVPTAELERPLKLAQVAIGILSCPKKGEEPVQTCSICCEEKLAIMMITMKCSHKFCSHCMKTYVEGKVKSLQVPIRCPQLRCKYFISGTKCKTFLPVTSYESLERALVDANIVYSDKVYCPFPNCSVLLDPHECLSSRMSSSSHSDSSCVECPVCQRLICVECKVPWHSSMSCQEYQNISLEERDAGDVTLHRLAQNMRWKRCQQCRRMIELVQGCYHMTCRCGHEFCYSCCAEYRHGQQSCQCVFWGEECSEDLVNRPAQQSDQWTWDCFDSLPMTTDSYSDQERSQLELIQRFLAGGFSLSDPHPCQSPPPCTDSYFDAMKDLQQLPWLESFVAVISDNYYEEYMQ